MNNTSPSADAWRPRFFTARDGRAEGGRMPGTHPAQKSPHWHQRGYLPHLGGAGRTQALTFRLGDSVPQEQLDRWRRELAFTEAFLPQDDPKQIELRRRIAAYEDAGHGECWLRQPDVAQIVERLLRLRDQPAARPHRAFPDYHDRFIRNARHLAVATEYIEDNPVKAGLCTQAKDWKFSSAWRRALAPGTAGMLPASK